MRRRSTSMRRRHSWTAITKIWNVILGKGARNDIQVGWWFLKYVSDFGALLTVLLYSESNRKADYENGADNIKPVEFESMLHVDISTAAKLAGFGRCQTLPTVVTFFIHAIGMSAIIVYSFYVYIYAPNRGFTHTLMPALLHVFGVGATVLTKSYFDISPRVGHLESMMLIIRCVLRTNIEIRLNLILEPYHWWH
jgi:hypothetical protein